jgi:glycosyltransferase involved in cell wall biosynthesis
MAAFDPEKTLISIVIPTYNSERTLRQCLNSVTSQTYCNSEVVIVDNDSTDGTLKIAAEFKVKIIRRACNPAMARNIGIESSSGSYLLFLDSDQVLSPPVLEECVKKCTEERVAMVMIPESFIGTDFWSSCSAIWRNHYKSHEQSNMRGVQAIYGEPRFFSRKALTEVGVFHAALLWGEDYDLYERLKHAGVKEGYIQSRIYHYELSTARSILIKDIRYARSMPGFVKRTQRRILPLMVRNVFLTFKAILKDSGSSPDMVLGCALLLGLKSCSIIIGFL